MDVIKNAYEFQNPMGNPSFNCIELLINHIGKILYQYFLKKNLMRKGSQHDMKIVVGFFRKSLSSMFQRNGTSNSRKKLRFSLNLLIALAGLLRN